MTATETIARPFTKILRIGTAKTYHGRVYSVFVKIHFDSQGELHITAVEGPLASGNALGGCGQFQGVGWGITNYAPGWSAEREAELRRVWERWHLNHMRAGTPVQETFLREHPVQATYPESHYDKALQALTEAKLNPDPETGYRYGHAWLKEEVPADVLEWLQSLPDTDREPAWI